MNEQTLQLKLQTLRTQLLADREGTRWPIILRQVRALEIATGRVLLDQTKLKKLLLERGKV